MRKKKIKLLVGDHSPKWYLMYSVFAAVIIIGFFSIFNYYSTVPQKSLTGLQTIDVGFETVDDVLYQDYSIPEVKNTSSSIVIYPYMILITFGIAGFVTTKLFYDKNNKKHRR